ncbi:MAG TPA: helix-turn-helix transcriptional regulator [Anaerolineales bacterium]|nr:helix-turn-helix transcriptional regulator [Anaerolineales bacterium]
MEKKNRTNTDELTHLIGKRLDESTDGDALARAAHYSRFHFQRIFHEETGETPGNCQRRLKLERAAYHLLQNDCSVTEIAFQSGFNSLEGFSRAFRKTAGISPSHFRRIHPVSWFFATPNDIHYDPVVGAAIRLTQQGKQGDTMDLTDVLLEHDLWLTRRFLESAQSLSDAELDQPLKGFDNPLLYRSEEKTLREMLDRLIFTKETWMASIHGRPMPEHSDKSIKGMLKRLDSAFGEFIALARKVRDEKLWDSSFMDMLCEPPETFTFSGMVAHVLTLSAYRRSVVIEALKQFGITDLGYGDPIEWQRAQAS